MCDCGSKSGEEEEGQLYREHAKIVVVGEKSCVRKLPLEGLKYTRPKLLRNEVIVG